MTYPADPADDARRRVFDLRSGRLLGRRVEGGPFPAKRRGPGEHEQEPRPFPIPPARVPHPLHHPSPESRPLTTRDRSADDNRDPVVFVKYDESGQTPAKSFTNAADISGAEDRAGEVILLSGNWYCDYSVDGGATWKRKDPSTVFPPGLANGFCCDQVVIYSIAINRFIWFMQHDADASGGAFRLAAAAPSDIRADFDHAWTYWDFRASNFALGTDDMDYPDLALSDTFLYLSTDAKGTSGRLVARIPLKEIAGGGTIGFQYTDPTKSTTAWGAHLVQGSHDGAFWVGHKDTSTLELFSIPDAGSTYSSTDVSVATYPTGALSSTGPNGNDWLAKDNSFPDFAVIGGARTNNQLWLAWTASAGSDGHGGFTFPNTHVRVATVDLATHKTVSELQVWNSNYAFAYPALSVNGRGEVAIILGWGGTGADADTAMGILGDFVVWYRDGSTITTKRWGDFVTVRPSIHREGMFGGYGYYTLKDSADASKCFYRPYYVLFSRKSLT